MCGDSMVLKYRQLALAIYKEDKKQDFITASSPVRFLRAEWWRFRLVGVVFVEGPEILGTAIERVAGHWRPCSVIPAASSSTRDLQDD